MRQKTSPRIYGQNNFTPYVVLDTIVLHFEYNIYCGQYRKGEHIYENGTKGDGSQSPRY